MGDDFVFYLFNIYFNLIVSRVISIRSILYEFIFDNDNFILFQFWDEIRNLI